MADGMAMSLEYFGPSLRRIAGHSCQLHGLCPVVSSYPVAKHGTIGAATIRIEGSGFGGKVLVGRRCVMKHKKKKGNESELGGLEGGMFDVTFVL